MYMYIYIHVYVYVSIYISSYIIYIYVHIYMYIHIYSYIYMYMYIYTNAWGRMCATVARQDHVCLLEIIIDRPLGFPINNIISHVWLTTDRFIHFQKNKVDEMLCLLRFQGNCQCSGYWENPCILHRTSDVALRHHRVCCFVLLTRYWGIVTVPGSFLFRGPGVAGSSPSTLTTSLVAPVPSSSFSNRHFEMSLFP